jgi:hypothetical protein
MLKIHLRQCHVNSKYHSGRVRCVRQRLEALGKLLGVGPPVTEARCAVGQCVDPSKVEHLQWKREQSVGVCVWGGGGSLVEHLQWKRAERGFTSRVQSHCNKS